MKQFLVKWGLGLMLCVTYISLNAQCKIDSLEYNLSACDNNEFYVFLSFTHDSTSNEGFYVAGNGQEYGSFSYEDLPVKVGPIEGDPERSYEFVVTDKENPDCSTAIEIGKVECGSVDCSVKELEVIPSGCDDSESFSVKINFEYKGFESFDLYGNEEYLGFFQVEDLPVEIEHFPTCGEGQEKIKICANDREDCCTYFEFDTPSCFNTCGFGDLKAEAVECSDSTFYAKLYFEHHLEGQDSFYVEVDDSVFKYFLYDELPIILGPFSRLTDQVYEFTVHDVSQDSCTMSAELDHGNCGCELSDFNFGFGDCTSDTTAVMELSFFTNSFSSFKIWINDQLLDEFEVSELPLRLENFPTLFESHHVKLGIVATDGNCEFVKEIEIPECQFDSLELCLADLELIELGCDGNGLYATIDLTHAGDHGIYFKVKGNGKDYGKYKYEDLPVTIGPLKDDVEVYELVVLDYEVDRCQTFIEFEGIDCGCGINEMKLDVGECTSDSTYEVYLDFSAQADTFVIYANAEFFGTYHTSQLPLTITDFPASGDEFDFIEVCIGDDANCCLIEEFKVPGCTTDACFVDIRKEITACDSAGMFYMILDFDHVGAHSASFIVKGNGYDFNYDYRDLPVKVGPFPAGEEFYVFEVCDREFHDCHVEVEVGKIICEDQCQLENITYEVGPCLDENKYQINLQKIETDFEGVDIYFNGEYLKFLKTNQLPIDLSVERGDDMIDKLEVCISDNRECCKTLEIEAPTCDQRCHLKNIKTDTTSCRNDSVSIIVSFDHEGGEGQFYVKGNGMHYGLFNYIDLPITIGPVAADGTKDYEFVVIDSANESCRIATEVGKINCENVGATSAERLLIIEATDGRIHLKIPDFITERTQMQIFDLQGLNISSRIVSSNSDVVVINVPELYHGMYVLHLTSQEGEIHTDKFILH